jgi:hypothetical protein
LAPTCSNCGGSEFVWANEVKTGTPGAGLSLRTRGEAPIGTRICQGCGHADLFLRDLDLIHKPHLWRPGEFVPIPAKRREPVPEAPSPPGPFPSPVPLPTPDPIAVPAPLASPAPPPEPPAGPPPPVPASAEAEEAPPTGPSREASARTRSTRRRTAKGRSEPSSGS